MINLASVLEQYGADLSSLILFDSNDPSLLPYSTLVAARDSGHLDLMALLGVYEWQSSPLVFLVDGDKIRDDNHFRYIRRCLALRGDASYIGIVYPGQLTIHRVALDTYGRNASRLCHEITGNSRITLPYLANSRPDVVSSRKWVSQIVLKLLQESINKLCKDKITDNDAISLTGRGLFLRFLADRDLLPTSLGPAEELFDNAYSAEQASQWLDATFNGDFLPISKGLLASLPESAYHSLGNIMYKAPGGQLHLGWQEKWDYLVSIRKPAFL